MVGVYILSFLLLTGEEIMKKVDSQPIPSSSESSVKMIIKKGGDVRERKMVVYTKSDGDIRYSVSKFLEPADVRGTQFLQISKKDETLQFLFLPSLNKSRRIAGGQKKTSFMGSELTYEDMERKKIEDYDHKLIREDENLYVVESTPKKGVDSQYSKAIFYVRKDDFAVLKTELYKDGKLFKVIENEITKVDGKYNIPTRTYVKNLESGNETELIIENIKVDIKVQDKYFSPDFLGKW
jgi:outer membrane lipoprotein-sorting protein